MPATAAFVTLTLNPAWDCTLCIDQPLRNGGVHNVDRETVTAGGKGINVAKLLAANGHPVIAAGLMGAADANRFQNALLRQGITPRFMSVGGTVRTNLMIRVPGTEYKLNRAGYPGLVVDSNQLADYVRQVSADALAVVMSGSLPADFPPETYALLIDELNRLRIPCVLDTSGAALVRGACAAPMLIKPNRQELEQLTGKSLQDDHAVAREIRCLTARHAVVIVSDGHHGAWFGCGSDLWRATSPDVPVIDTTGAGDALLGQFCADYFPGRCLTEHVMARAMAAGAAACEQAGTPQPAIERIVHLARKTQISQVNRSRNF